MNAVENARAEVEALAGGLELAKEAEATHLATIDRAEVAYQDDPSAFLAREFLTARDDAKLATVRGRGCERRWEAAREVLRQAELASARATLASQMPIANRAHLFEACADAVAALAGVLADEPILVELAGAELDAALEAQARCLRTRELAKREIHARVAEQHAACAAIATACES